MSSTAQTPAERAAEQRARKAATVNPRPRQDPIIAPTSTPGHPPQMSAAQVEYQRQLAVAQCQAFLALSPEHQAQLLREADVQAQAAAVQTPGFHLSGKTKLALGVWGLIYLMHRANRHVYDPMHPGLFDGPKVY